MQVMNADVGKLLATQFLTALADNAILFVAVAMVLSGALHGDWYVPALQACFLVAFVVLAPWAGAFADTRSKPSVLWMANMIKAVGAGMMLMDANPLLAYAVVGIGAAVYSPAKYGVIPELVRVEELVKVNGWVEGSTIVAILLGSVMGGVLADHSIAWALMAVMSLYVLSGAMAWWMSHLPSEQAHPDAVLTHFKTTIRTLMSTPRARFASLGVSLFWATAVVFRLIIIAWAPVVLLLHTSTDISLLTLFIALGIAAGAFLAPRLIPLERLAQGRYAAYGLGICILLLIQVDDLWLARALLFAAGVCGGLFVVPINAALQDIGHHTVGSGHAVAVQHFFENIAMLTATGLFAWASGMGVSPLSALLVLGLFVLSMTMLIARRLPGKEVGID